MSVSETDRLSATIQTDQEESEIEFIPIKFNTFAKID